MGLATRPTTLFEAAGTNRRLKVEDTGWMTVSISWWTWLSMSRRRREGRPRAVAFPLGMIRGGWFRPAVWWRRGVLVLDVPGANDPWGRRSNRQRNRGVFPKTRPHKIRFGPRQSPVFEMCARELGVEEGEARG